MSSDVMPAEPAVVERLGRERNVWLCTLRPDGSPHVTPVWFVFRRGTWWVAVEQRSVKARNLRRDPRVSLALEDGEKPVVAEGEARLHEDGFAPEVREAFRVKYAWDPSVPYRDGRPAVVLEVRTRRWLLSGVAQ